tara:strand:+ start:200 stop:502 length:303 start_codon:yes stop_codon:yes gene_type:complete
MKIVAATLLILIFSVSFAMKADEVLVTKNQSGGFISLTFDECPIPELYGARVAVTTSSKEVVLGCWFVLDDKIIVIWFPEKSPPVKFEYEFFDFKVEKLI